MPSVVLTRAAIAAYADALAPLTAIAMPVTRTAPPRDPAALARALDQSSGQHYAAIVIASARAADALASARTSKPLPEVWAVGPATQRALAAAGITARTPPIASDGAQLAHAMVAARDLTGQRVLVPRAEDGREEAIAILRGAGAEVTDIAAYRTLPTPADAPEVAEARALLLAGDTACVVFAPSQVRALAAIVGSLAALAATWIAIGDTTGAVLREAGIAEVSVATTPTPEGVAKAVAAVYPSRR